MRKFKPGDLVTYNDQSYSYHYFIGKGQPLPIKRVKKVEEVSGFVYYDKKDGFGDPENILDLVEIPPMKDFL